MINVKTRKCKTEGCGKIPSFAVAGTRTGEYCAHHSKNGMVDVRTKKRRNENGGVLCAAREEKDDPSEDQKSVQN
ncbi:unnamed protein product [Ascophyllum nodosum]